MLIAKKEISLLVIERKQCQVSRAQTGERESHAIKKAAPLMTMTIIGTQQFKG